MSFPRTNSDKPFIDHVRMLNNYKSKWWLFVSILSFKMAAIITF